MPHASLSEPNQLLCCRYGLGTATEAERPLNLIKEGLLIG